MHAGSSIGSRSGREVEMDIGQFILAYHGTLSFILGLLIGMWFGFGIGYVLAATRKDKQEGRRKRF